MYNWRKMTGAQRQEVLELRKKWGQPWHGPPHGLELKWRHVSAACYEHHAIIGRSPERMARFEQDLRVALAPICEGIAAWCILPNHYHALVHVHSDTICRKTLGLLHGRTSREWNLEEKAPGRTCWHRCLIKPVKNLSHRMATLNYIHHNPVHHGYVSKWQEWPFSSAAMFLENLGPEEVARIWKQHPVLGLGDGWDAAEL